jgi:PAS domain S-box-containing protein
MPEEAKHRDWIDLETGADLRSCLSDAILDAPTDSIVACDRDGIIRFWNPGAQRLFGYSSAEAVGRSLDLIIPERLRQRHWDGYRRVMMTGETRYGTGDVLSVPATRKDGATVSVEFTVYRLQIGARLVGIAALLRDVTRRFNEMRALKRKFADILPLSSESASSPSSIA